MRLKNTVIVEQFGKGGFEEYRIPSLAVTARGTLLAAYEARGQKGNDWAPAWVGVRRREAKGGEFEPPIYPHEGLEGFGQEKPGTATWHNPVLIAGQDLVHLIFGKDYEKAYHCVSQDDGKSFGPPVEITQAFREFPYSWNVCAAGPGHGIMTSNKRLVAPVWLAQGQVRRDKDPSGRVKDHFPSRAGCIYSDDRGKSWKAGFLAWGIENASETAVAQLGTGKLLFNFRNERFEKCRVLGIADESLAKLERAWSEASLPDPTCFGSMAKGGESLYFVNCANFHPDHLYGDRVNLTIYETMDDPARWQPVQLVDQLGGYADIAVGNGRLYVFYEKGFHGRVEELALKEYDLGQSTGAGGTNT